jgi:hypothetical protein
LKLFLDNLVRSGDAERVAEGQKWIDLFKVEAPIDVVAHALFDQLRHMVTSQRQAATGDTSGWRPKSRCGRPARPTSGGGTGTLVSVAQA